MSFRRWPLLLAGAVTTLAAACGSKPPPAPVAPPEAQTAKPAEPPPPPPAKPCKALEEKCEADPSKKVKIAASKLVFTPAQGWTYAQGDIATIAQAPGGGPTLAVAEVDVGDSKQEPAKRDAALEALAHEAGVTLPKKKVSWKKPDESKDVAGMKLGLWQVEGGSRGDKKGPLLIFAASRDAGRALVGFGFVADDDSSGADAVILQTIESIAASGE